MASMALAAAGLTTLAVAVVGCKDGSAAEEREDQDHWERSIAHSNILSSDFGLGRSLGQWRCQSVSFAKLLIAKDRWNPTPVTDGSTLTEKSKGDP
jgi:hypothetical protein